MVLTPLRPQRGMQPDPDGARSESQQAAPVNLDPDARDHTLWARHARLLRIEPLLQRLPYRDRQLGVQLGGVARFGRPLLLVIYRGSLRAAREDMRALLARFHDEGSEYALRYQPAGAN